jgi:DNA polymerase
MGKGHRIKRLHLDLETFSSVDLSRSGVYKYVEAEDFEILLFGVSADGGEVQVYDLASGDKLPTNIREALTDPKVIMEQWV